MPLLEALLSTCADSVRDSRDRALLQTAFLSPRLGAPTLTDLNLADLQEVEGGFDLRLPETVELRDEAAEDVRAWLNRGEKEEGPLFPKIGWGARIGGRWSAKGVHSMVEARIRQAVSTYDNQDFLDAWNLTAAVPMFSRLDSLEMVRIGRLLRPVLIEKSRTVFQAGDPGDSMFFVVSGKLEVDLGVETIELDSDFFGELGLLTEGDRSATIVAADRTQLLELKAEDMPVIERSNPEMAEEIRRVARSRLKADRRRLLDEQAS